MANGFWSIEAIFNRAIASRSAIDAVRGGFQPKRRVGVIEANAAPVEFILP
ncbi:hypothetical protein HNR60_001583 [Rhodopseudomonas rhenobacensis]|uniref:Uncharacterized protein n=1 Tax=Rhodopseudomonas rhenobacensis TaxID=87461 RepID=A0A7W8DYG9_9BRAD|nr:hypothetical protein [Rhodopseudomonas rhenobacensis]